MQDDKFPSTTAVTSFERLEWAVNTDASGLLLELKSNYPSSHVGHTSIISQSAVYVHMLPSVPGWVFVIPGDRWNALKEATAKCDGNQLNCLYVLTPYGVAMKDLPTMISKLWDSKNNEFQNPTTKAKIKRWCNSATSCSIPRTPIKDAIRCPYQKHDSSFEAVMQFYRWVCKDTNKSVEMHQTRVQPLGGDFILYLSNSIRVICQHKEDVEEEGRPIWFEAANCFHILIAQLPDGSISVFNRSGKKIGQYHLSDPATAQRFITLIQQSHQQWDADIVDMCATRMIRAVEGKAPTISADATPTNRWSSSWSDPLQKAFHDNTAGVCYIPLGRSYAHPHGSGIAVLTSALTRDGGKALRHLSKQEFLLSLLEQINDTSTKCVYLRHASRNYRGKQVAVRRTSMFPSITGPNKRTFRSSGTNVPYILIGTDGPDSGGSVMLLPSEYIKAREPSELANIQRRNISVSFGEAVAPNVPMEVETHVKEDQYWLSTQEMAQYISDILTKPTENIRITRRDHQGTKYQNRPFSPGHYLTTVNDVLQAALDIGSLRFHACRAGD